MSSLNDPAPNAPAPNARAPANEQFDPFLIRTRVFIYYYAGENGSINSTSSAGNKKIIRMINLKYALGYAKLKTKAGLNKIEFVVDEDTHNKSIPIQEERAKKERKMSEYRNSFEKFAYGDQSTDVISDVFSDLIMGFINLNSLFW